MIIEFGHFALILALMVAIAQMVLPFWGARIGDRRLMAIADPAALAQLGLLLVAFLALWFPSVVQRNASLQPAA